MISFRTVWLWTALVAASGVLGFLLHAAGFPAAYLIGPMLVGMAFAVRGARLHVPQPFLYGAQAVIGCLVARSLDPSILTTVADDWAAMALVVLTTVVASGFAGWVIARTHLLPGTTAAWGCAPGAASGMVAMSEEFGADPRLVAFMQFLRVTLVVVTATLVSRLIFGVTATEAAPGAAVHPFLDQLPELAATLGVAAVGALAARLLRVPSGAVFLPLILAAVLQGTGVMTITLPPWLLVAAFSLIGWWVGLRFTRETVQYAFRALPVMLAGIVALILLCGLSAVMLVWLVGTDPLTAYLATTPGGLDAIAIIAVGSNADISFVLALQTVRLFVVIVTGPMIARLICRLV